MNCVEYTPDLLSPLTRLVNAQMADIPPGWSLSEAQVDQVVSQVSSLWDVHFPEQNALFELETLCVLERGNLLAAAQWGYPTHQSGAQRIGSSSVLFWIAAEPGSIEGLSLLLETLETHSRLARCPRITTTRFSFGVGWLGIPAPWPHVIEALQAAGFVASNHWVILTGKANIPEVKEPESLGSMSISWQVDEHAAEWDLRLHSGDDLAGECQAWGIPRHFSTCEGYSNWVTVEWLGVEPGFQRKGIGSWLIAEQIRRQAQRSLTHVIIWTETDNQPLLCLGESLGFQVGPECWEFEKVLA